MAQKASKLLAARNATTLRRTHLISLCIHTFYLLLRLLLFRTSFTRTSMLLYLVLSTPSFGIEYWLDKLGRPTYTSSSTSSSSSSTVQKAGEDLDAKGLTEFLWDVLYWTWGCVVLAAVAGDRAWWAWGVVVPGYSGYLAVGMYRGVTGGGGMMGGGGAGEGGMDGPGGGGGESKRQKKMEKRGGREKVQYR